jgi:hypothetical protein
MRVRARDGRKMRLAILTSVTKNGHTRWPFFVKMAEREGFEPSVRV